MCLLIAAPAGVVVPPEHIRHAALRNSHGVGIAARYTDANGVPRVDIWKHPDGKNHVEELIDIVKATQHLDRIIHLRFATSGKQNGVNTHPFYLTRERTVAMAHNGVLSIRNTNKHSDTVYFARHVLRYMQDGWWRDTVAREQLERLLNGDRMALLTASDGIVIFNKYRWTTDNDVMYSNEMYKAYEPKHARNWPQYGQYQPPRQQTPTQHRHTATPEEAGLVALSLLEQEYDLPIENDPLIGYFAVALGDSAKSHIWCERCVPPAVKLKDDTRDITLSMHPFLFEEKCIRCSRLIADIAEDLFNRRARVEMLADRIAERIRAFRDGRTKDTICVACGEKNSARPICESCREKLNKETVTLIEQVYFAASYPETQEARRAPVALVTPRGAVKKCDSCEMYVPNVCTISVGTVSASVCPECLGQAGNSPQMLLQRIAAEKAERTAVTAAKAAREAREFNPNKLDVCAACLKKFSGHRIFKHDTYVCPDCVKKCSRKELKRQVGEGLSILRAAHAQYTMPLTGGGDHDKDDVPVPVVAGTTEPTDIVAQPT